MSGDHICCEECGRQLEIVCPKGHDDPMEMRRKSKGPVPPAPTKDEPPRQRRAGGARVRRPVTPESARQKEIGATLRAARVAKGFSVEELASLVNRKPSSFSVWEVGGAGLSWQLIDDFCVVLNLSRPQLTNEFATKKRVSK